MKSAKSFFFENITLKQTVFKNTFWITFGHLTSRMLRALLIIYAARVLGVAEYGVFSYTVGLAGFFIVFSDIGLTPLLTRESARLGDKRNKFFITALILKGIFVICGSGIIAISVPFITKITAAITLLPLIIILFIFDTFRDFFIGFLRALEKMEREAFNNILTNFLVLLFGVAILLFSPTSKMLLLAYMIGTGIGLVHLIWLMRNYFVNTKNNFDASLIKPILLEAWPFSLATMLNIIMLSTDIIMLGWFKDETEIGFYAAAQKIMILLYFLPGFISVSLFPILSRLHGQDNERFRSIFEKSMAGSFFLSLPLVITGALIAPALIRFLYGISYEGSIPPFQVLLLNSIFVFSNSLLGYALFACNKQKNSAISLTIGALGNIILNLFFIPSFGAFGAATATIISQGLVTGINWYFLKREIHFRALIYLPKITIATALTGFLSYALFSLGLHVVFILVLSAGFYIMMMFLLREPLLKQMKLS